MWKGDDTVTDFVLLQSKIDASGMPMTTIASRSGIRRETLYGRLKGRGAFKADEIAALARVLGLKNSERDAIFFAKRVV